MSEFGIMLLDEKWLSEEKIAFVKNDSKTPDQAKSANCCIKSLLIMNVFEFFSRFAPVVRKSGVFRRVRRVLVRQRRLEDCPRRAGLGRGQGGRRRRVSSTHPNCRHQYKKKLRKVSLYCLFFLLDNG